MGGPSPSSADVRFAFDLALEAARQLYTLSDVIEDKQTAWSTAAGKATDA